MTFFVVTAAIMAVSILLIYKLCRFFGLELKWISLVLCAMMAFGVNGATIVLSPFLDQSHYLKLTALVLVSAGVVTLINDYLLRREERQLATADGAVLSVAEEAAAGEEPKAEALLAAADGEEKAGEKSEAGEALSQRLQEAMKANAPAEEPAAEPEAQAEGPQAEPASEEPQAEAQAEAEPAEAPQAEEHSEDTQAEETATPEAPAETVPQAEAVPEPEAAPTAEPTAEPEPIPEPEPAPEPEPVSEDEPEEPAEEPAPQEEPLPEKAAEPVPEPASEPMPERRTITLEPEAAEAAVAELSSLDEILDFAYSNKEKDVSAAITAYRAAIDRYPDDSYTPFLIIELAGLYKERASYSEAINLYAESLGMPIIAGDDAMVQEFSKTLRYLGTVQDILNKHHALATPFSKLTPEILQEIEAEFAKRQAK